MVNVMLCIFNHNKNKLEKEEGGWVLPLLGIRGGTLGMWQVLPGPSPACLPRLSPPTVLPSTSGECRWGGRDVAEQWLLQPINSQDKRDVPCDLPATVLGTSLSCRLNRMQGRGGRVPLPGP